MKRTAIGASLLLLAGLAQPAQALNFNFSYAPGTDAQAIAGFQAAGNAWSSIFSDPITINIQIGYQPLAPGIIAQAGSSLYYGGYSLFNSAAANDASSVLDTIAVSNLPGASSLSALINATPENPNGFGSFAPYLDNNASFNNSAIFATSANLRALGLLPAVDANLDAQITFSSAFSFDFNAGDGVAPGSFDFVGVAIHEIGHAMGFVSGVDDRDYYTQGGPVGENDLINSWMDAFRFSNTQQFGAQRDWTIGPGTRYFSIDNGATSLATFSDGVFFGDGRQASHWEDNMGWGVMDPTAAFGELLSISNEDVWMFDVLGYDVIQGEQPVPEASTLLGGAAIAGLALWRSRRRA